MLLCVWYDFSSLPSSLSFSQPEVQLVWSLRFLPLKFLIPQDAYHTCEQKEQRKSGSNTYLSLILFLSVTPFPKLFLFSLWGGMSFLHGPEKCSLSIPQSPYYHLSIWQKSLVRISVKCVWVRFGLRDYSSQTDYNRWVGEICVEIDRESNSMIIIFFFFFFGHT